MLEMFEIKIESSNLNPMLRFLFTWISDEKNYIYTHNNPNKHIFYFLFCEKKNLRQTSCQILKLIENYKSNKQAVFCFTFLDFKTLKLFLK